MNRRRFFAPPEAFSSGGRVVTLAPDEARHLKDVLRLRGGDEAFVFDGEGREYACVVEEAKRNAAKLSVHAEVEPARPESPLHLTLAVALLKGEKFDLVVQKATELGVTQITPIVTKLADVRLRDELDGERRAARWRRIALEAAKQSGRARIPSMNTPIAFATFIGNAASDGVGLRLMFAERGGQNLAKAINQRSSTRPNAAAALVGSEGGWTDEEIAAASEAGWSIITLGGRTLRAETAAIVAAALLQHLFGDLK